MWLVDQDVAAVPTRALAAQVEAEAGASHVAGLRVADPPEAGEEPAQVLARDPDPTVADGDERSVRAGGHLDLYQATPGRELDRVVDQVEDDAPHSHRVSQSRTRLPGQPNVHLVRRVDRR